MSITVHVLMKARFLLVLVCLPLSLMATAQEQQLDQYKQAMYWAARWVMQFPKVERYPLSKFVAEPFQGGEYYSKEVCEVAFDHVMENQAHEIMGVHIFQAEEAKKSLKSLIGDERRRQLVDECGEEMRASKIPYSETLRGGEYQGYSPDALLVDAYREKISAIQQKTQKQGQYLNDLRAGRVAPKSCAEWYYAKGQDVGKLTAPISSISLTPPKGTGKVTGEVMQISGRTLQIARFMPLVGIDYDEPAILLLGDKAKIFNGDKVRVGVNVLAYGSQASVRNGQTPVIQVACITAVTPSDQLNGIDQFFK